MFLVVVTVVQYICYNDNNDYNGKNLNESNILHN
jgi:hypothetical protein